MQKYIMQKSKKQRWNMGKRILAVVLAICMVCMVQPDLWNTVTVQAADHTITQDETWEAQMLEAGTYTIEPGVTVTVKGRLMVDYDVTIKGGGKLVRGASAAYFEVSGGNLTLQNIEIDGASLPSSSAMIDARSSAKVTLENGCWIHHCYKDDGTGEGAALRLDGSSAVFQEAVIENCQARNYGGAIYTNHGSSLIIHSGTYKENRTTLETASYGGGFLYNKASKVEIYGGNFINNTSAGYGGCIYNTGVEGTETYLYGGYFQGNQSTYTRVGSGAVFYSSRNTDNTIFNLSGNVQFCGDDVAGSGTDGVFLDLAGGSTAIRKAKISSELIYPLALYLEAQEGRVIAEGVDEYTLQEKDMKKISFTDIDSSGKIWYAKLDKENNQIILTTTNPEYGMYVTYSANGGTGAISDSREYFSTETVTVKSGDSLHRDGYTFGGWNTKPDGTGTTYWADDTFQITDDVTLYAQWEENQGAAKYMVKYNKNNGTIMNESNYRGYTYGTGLTLPTPTRRGYTFGGWYDNETYEGTAVTDISATETGNKEYWAKWKDDIAPIIGTLGYSYEPVNLWQWLIGKEDLVITVPVTEEGSGADEISYTVTPEGGTASERTAAIADGKAEITVSADFKGTITIVCTDKAGNISASVTVGSGLDVTGIIIEDNAPQISFQVNGGDVSAEAYDAVPDITVTVSDDTDNAISAGIASVTYQIGNGEEESVQQDFTESMKTNATFTIPADKIPANGTEITVKAVDHAGNTVSAKQTVKVITDADKVAAAKIVVEDTLEDYTATNSTTKQEIQEKIDIALTNAGITDVTATVGDLTKTEATTETEGSISGSITIVSDNDSDVTDSVPIHKTIAPFHTHSYTWIITKEATADEEGEMTGTCICGEITTETIPKTGESGSGTVIVKEDEENECNGSLEDKEDVKGKVSLTDTEKGQLNTGEDLVIILRLKDVSVAADTQEKTEIQNKLETNTLGTFLDIELLKQIGGTETKITETTDEIEITFEIPEHLRNTDDTMTRTYQIMRNHDGVVDILDVENYDESAHLLTFKTDKFSTYALVYRDDAKNPTDTPGPTETPGTPSPTPVTTETPGTPTPTPITTETPDTATPTPVPTNTPGTPSPTPVTTETPGTPSPTPVTTETPGTPSPTPITTDTPDTATPTPGIPTATPGSTATPDQPEPGILPEEVLAKNALSLNALLKVSQTGKKINITWGQVAGADGYDVYVQYCSKKFTEKSITAVKSGKKTKVTVRKVNGKSLNLKKNYKIYILAYKLVNGKKITLGRTIIAHIVGRKNAKYTNVKAVRAKKSSYSLKQGKTAVIKASTVLVSKGKKQLSNAHAKKFRYATDNKKVATVSKKGKIKAVGKGTCTIYVYARNGYAKKIKVTVR